MTAIVGGQEPTPQGYRISSNVNVYLNQNNSWTVPANSYFEGFIYNNGNGAAVEFNSRGYYLSTPAWNTGLNNTIQPIKLGPGAFLHCRNTNGLIVTGVLFTNES